MLRGSGHFALTLAVLTGCSIDDIDYAGKGCSPEAPCPDGLVCRADVCVAPGKDAAIDAPPDDSMVDARMPELRCGEMAGLRAWPVRASGSGCEKRR